MLHKTRVHIEPLRVPTPEYLARYLATQTWTLCQAFAWGDLLLLNDSTSEDGASEWAIVKGGRQVESITFSWCTEEEALSYLLRLQAGELCTDTGPLEPRFHPRTQPCAACA